MAASTASISTAVMYPPPQPEAEKPKEPTAINVFGPEEILPSLTEDSLPLWAVEAEPDGDGWVDPATGRLLDLG